VSYDANLDEAIAAILSAAEGDERIYKDPAPWAKVTTLGDSAVTILQAAEASPSLMADPNAFLQHYGNIAVEKTIFFVPKILVALIILWVGSYIAKRI